MGLPVSGRILRKKRAHTGGPASRRNRQRDKDEQPRDSERDLHAGGHSIWSGRGDITRS